jgi:pyruvate/2-oxoglutarate dehydrogenase complex dihydrolipoamide acyltransferase (E2) component
MPTLVPVRVPDLGAGSHPLRLSAWFVDPGDLVAPGERLFEVFLSGVSCDVTAESAGRITRIEKDLDVPVSPGDIVAWIEPIPTAPVPPPATTAS